MEKNNKNGWKFDASSVNAVVINALNKKDNLRILVNPDPNAKEILFEGRYIDNSIFEDVEIKTISEEDIFEVWFKFGDAVLHKKNAMLEIILPQKRYEDIVINSSGEDVFVGEGIKSDNIALNLHGNLQLKSVASITSVYLNGSDCCVDARLEEDIKMIFFTAKGSSIDINPRNARDVQVIASGGISEITDEDKFDPNGFLLSYVILIV